MADRLGRLARRPCRGASGSLRRPSRTLAGAADVIENPVDHRPLGNEGDDPHRRAARRTPEGIDLEDLLEELGPASACLAEREGPGLDDDWGLTSRRLARAPRAAHAIGIVPVIPRHHLS